MGRIAGSRRLRNRRPWLPLVAAAVFALLHPSVSSASGASQDQGRDPTMRVPGGTARLLKAVRIPVPVEPARAFLAVIRKSYLEKLPKTPVDAAAYLDAVTRLAEAGRKVEPGRLDAAAAFFEACGFDNRRHRMSTDPAVVQRTRLMQRAGYPIQEWTEWWSANQGSPEPEKTKYTQAAVPVTGEADEIPALLPPGVWSSVLRRNATTTLAASILADRGAALLYYGLFALDDETLAYVARSPALVSSLAATAGEFAAFSDAVVVRGDRMVLPGGAAAVPLWEQLVGAPASAPDRFIAGLFSRDAGRLAWMFDTVAHLDGPHQAFALATAVTDAAARLEAVRSLYAVFATFEPNAAPFGDKPFGRSALDPGLILMQLRVSDDGRLAPADAAFWGAVLASSQGGRNVAGLASSDGVTAPPVVGLLASQPVSARRQYFEAALFAQRLAAAQRANQPAAPDAMASAVAAFINRPALMVTLERLGFTDPADYAQAASNTDSLHQGSSRRAALALAQFQGALAVVVRLHDVGAVTPTVAQDLARALITAAGGDSSVATWIETRLLPALPKPASGAAETAEARLLDALAGVTADRQRPIVQWEDQTYRVDVAAGERVRLRRIREKQADVTLDDAIDFHRAWSRLLGATTPADVREAAEQVCQSLPRSDLLDGDVSLFGNSLPPMRESIISAARAMASGRSADVRSEATQRFREATDVLLADVLASVTYALAMGDPETAALLDGNPARFHDFAFAMPSSVGWWRAAEESSKNRDGQQVMVRGSLFVLNAALGRDWMRPISFDIPEIGRRMPPEDMRGLGEAVAVLNPYRLSDADRDILVARLRRGRERIAGAGTAAELESLAQAAGVEGQRRRLIKWASARDRSAVWAYFSLVEILDLGAEESRPGEFAGWGVPRRPLDGCLDVWFPRRLGWQQMAGRLSTLLMSAHVIDLQLHVVEVLDELRLPSVLVPAVLSFATWDIAMESPMTDGDDWLGLVRGAQSLPRDRIADYVSALTAEGTLVPVQAK